MTMRYDDFLSRKHLLVPSCGVDVEPESLNPSLFPFQRDLVCRVTVPGEPVPKARARVLSRGTYTPKRTREAEERVRSYLAASRWWTRWPVQGRLRVELLFFTTSKRRTDLDNLAKLALDASNGAVWVDDSQIDDLHIRRVRVPVNPSTVMVVWRVTEAGGTV